MLRRLPAILAWIAAVALVFAAARLEAQAAPVEFECKTLAGAVAALADFRDADADLEKVLRIAARRSGIRSKPHWDVVEREIRRLWREKLPAEMAEMKLYQRCIAQLGNMAIGIDS